MDRELETNPALPALIILLFFSFILWAIPHILRFALALFEELFLLLEEIVIGVVRGATIVWNSWARLKIDAAVQARL